MYIVLEIQVNKDGTVGTLISKYDSREESLQKYYQILSYAAVSEVPKHSAMIITDDAMVVKCECFIHDEEVEENEVPEVE